MPRQLVYHLAIRIYQKLRLWEKAGAVEGIEEPSLREERYRQLDTYPSTAGPWTLVTCRSCELSAHKAQDGKEPKFFMANIHIEADTYHVCLSRPEIPH